MFQESDLDIYPKQQKVTDVVERLKNIANQMDRYNNTMSLEKAINMLLDEIEAMLLELITVKDIKLYNKKKKDYSLFVQQKWQQFFETYRIEDFEYFMQTQQNIQDDTKIQKIDDIDIKNENSMEVLAGNGIKIREANHSDIMKINNLLEPHFNPHYEAWAVENRITQVKFSDFIKNTGDIQTRLLWHGSKNENWWGIINSGLIIQPKDVIIAGKMFGEGIYFATNAEKAINFTSVKVSNKRRRLSNTCFMGIYDVAYGTPHDVYTYDKKFSDFNYNELQKVKKGAHCLHAHEGEMLKNEEIVIYKEEQVTIKYLVEIKQ